MGIAKAQFNGILSGIFTAGNTIKLYTTVPDETTETGGNVLSGTGVSPYKIQEGDFSVSGGAAQSAKNIMLYLYEGKTVTANGFGIWSPSNELLYFGAFESPIELNYNDVPAIKKYNGSGEGIRVTITSTEASVST